MFNNNEVNKLVEHIDKSSNSIRYTLHDIRIGDREAVRLSQSLQSHASRTKITSEYIGFDYSYFKGEHSSKTFFNTLKDIDNLYSLSIKSTVGISIVAFCNYLRMSKNLSILSLRNCSIDESFKIESETTIDMDALLVSALKENESIQNLYCEGFTGISFNESWLKLLKSKPTLQISFDLDLINPIHIELRKQSNKNKKISEAKRRNPASYRDLIRQRQTELSSLKMPALTIQSSPPKLSELASEQLLLKIIEGKIPTAVLNNLPFCSLWEILQLNTPKLYEKDYFLKNGEKSVIDAISKKYNLPKAITPKKPASSALLTQPAAIPISDDKGFEPK